MLYLYKNVYLCPQIQINIKNTMTKKCLLPFLMLFLHIAVMAQSIETDPMVGGLQKELQYNFSQLKNSNLLVLIS